MQGHGIPVGALVVRLHDVDLAIVRPVGRVSEPQRRPCRAAIGRMNHVEEEESMVVFLIRRDTHRSTAGSLILGSGVNPQNGGRVRGMRQVHLVCSRRVHIAEDD